MEAIKTKRKGVFGYLYMYRGGFNTKESGSAKRNRFEAELKAICAKDPGFARYVQEYHRGYGQGINCFDTDKFSSEDLLLDLGGKAA